MTNGFTEKRVLAFEPPSEGAAYRIYWDADTAGLGLRVTKAGARSYVFEKRIHGKTARVTIGDPKAWQLEKARARARELTVDVDKGRDPRLVAQEQRREAEAAQIEGQRREQIVSAVWSAYIEAVGHSWGERHREDHANLARMGGEKKKRGKGQTKAGPLAPLMTLRLSELTADGIADWLKRESAKRPTSTAQAFRLLRAFIHWTAEKPEYKGVVPADACTARAVRERVPRVGAKDDCLQVEQLPAWFSGVRGLSNSVISAYLQTVLLTGARREEVLSLQWRAVDFTWKTIMIHGKTGDRKIPLTPFVASLLSALPRRNRWVFSSEAAGEGRLVEPRIGHNAALKRAGIPHLTLHGLRRSFATLSEWIEAPSGVVAQLQGHAPSATIEKHYKPRPVDLLRMWHEKLEAWTLEKGGIHFERPKAEKPPLALVKSAA